MADVVTTTIYENGPRNAIVGFTSVSDGTGESAVTKVDATASGPFGVMLQGRLVYPGVHLEVVGIYYDIMSMKLRLQWDAAADTDFLVLGGAPAEWNFMDQRGFGIKNPNNTGATGNINFTTIGANLNATYTVILKLIKGI